MSLRSLVLMVALPLLLLVGAALLLIPRDILRQPLLPAVEADPAPYMTSSVKRTTEIAVVEFEEPAIPPPQLVVFASPVDSAEAVSPAVEEATVADRRWTTARGLNIRTGPSVRDTLISSLPFGTPVNVLETSGTWAHVEAGEITGWLSANFLSNEDPSAN